MGQQMTKEKAKTAIINGDTNVNFIDDRGKSYNYMYFGYEMDNFLQGKEDYKIFYNYPSNMMYCSNLKYYDVKVNGAIGNNVYVERN